MKNHSQEPSQLSQMGGRRTKYLEDELGLEKDVEESEPEEGGEAAHQGSAEEQVLAVGGEEGSSGESGEDHGRHHEGVGDDGGVDPDGEIEKRSCNVK